VSNQLVIAKDLALPIDAATQKLAFMGKNGSGKSYAAMKLAEQMLHAGIQVVIIDPVGVWYGLRLAADGKSPGIAIPIFGGLHGDIPLEHTAGAVVANAIADQHLSAVLDVSQMIASEQRRFVTAFATQFFERQKASPSAVFVFLEECQEFVPQIPQQGEQHMVHAFQRMCKIGRNFGIGIGLISPRPQEIAKKVLNMTECFFAFQMTGPQERKAIRDYVSEKGEDVDVVAELPKYAVGQCRVWSPQWLKISRTIKFNERETYDSSSTPKVGAKPIQTRSLASVDLMALESQMAETIERAKLEDPAELRRQLAERDRKIRQLESAQPTPAIDQAATTREVSIARADFRREIRRILGGSLGTLLAAANKQAELVTYLSGQLEQLDKYLIDESNAEESRAEVQVGNTKIQTGANQPSAKAMGRSTQAPARPIAATLSRNSASSASRNSASNGDGAIGRTPQRMLNAMRLLESIGTTPASRKIIGGLVGVSPSTGTFRTYLSELRRAGCIEDVSSEAVRLTDAGRAQASDDGLPSTLGELHAVWVDKFSGTVARMFSVLLDHYPSPITRASLGNAVGIDPTTGTFRTYLSELRRTGAVVDVSREAIAASDMLFPEGLS
jgi:uncharacterized protein